MKIIQIIDTLNIGGAEKMCIQLANLFFEKGHDVSILYFQTTKNNLLDQVHNNPFYFYKVLRLIQQYDIAHVHMRTSLRIIYLSTLFGSLFKRVVFLDHTGGIEQFISSSKGIFILQAMRSVKYVSVYNELCLKSVNRFNLNSNNANVISNFVTKPAQIKMKIFPFDLNNLEILVVGNFRSQKNLLFLISMCKEMNLNSISNHRFHIMGAVNDLNYYKQFIEMIYSNNIKKHFIIYNDISNVFNFPGKVNLAIMPSKEESGPLVLIEYLLLNLPFLAHNVGDITNKIASIMPNRVIDNLIPSDWVDKIQSIDFLDNMKDYDLIYNSEFSEKVAYQKWMEVYNSLQVK
jgi:glycosyltransferase involved in cell wall biosynthesis